MSKQYKVGEFAKNLGVSVGFLKHHERYGTLTPHISPSGYRYYEYNQAMQAFQCLRLQNLGFTSKQIAHMLTHSSELNLYALMQDKKMELQNQLKFQQEILNYLNLYIQPFQDKPVDGTSMDTWSIIDAEPFYYLENSSERQFIEDPSLQEIAAKWINYVPMTEVISRVSLSSSDVPSTPLQISSWNMGMAIRRSYAETLQVPDLEKVQLITPGKCLVYHFMGTRTVNHGHAHLHQMLDRPIELCRKHCFTIRGDIYEFNTFCTTYGSTTYVRETILIPIKD